jgi:hypothetical protein
MCGRLLISLMKIKYLAGAPVRFEALMTLNAQETSVDLS